jgi:hypothetical protein
MTARLRAFLKDNPKCRVCGEISDTVRQQSNPPWGLDESGAPRETVEAWLASGPDPEDAAGVCEEHLRWSRSGSGGWLAPRSSKKEQSNWMKRSRERAVEARTALIRALGEKCHGCEGVFPYEEMRVRVPDRSRLDFGIQTRAEWYAFVVRHEHLLADATLLCMTCGPSAPSTAPHRVGVREQVLGAYGGRCWESGCSQTEGLLIGAKHGTPPLKWPNGNKYTSEQKLKWLVQNGFPTGYLLACPPHLHRLQRG